MARKSRKVTKTDEYTPIKTAIFFPTSVYARISIDGSHSEDSIDSQISICKEYINASNELTIGSVFTDLGYSGTNFDRPGYSDMMAGVLCGDVKCVIVKDLSRLGRTYIEVGELLFDTFVQHGVRFISVNDDYDSFADDAGRKKLLILFKNLVNHMYSKDLGKKIRSAHAAKKQRGELAGIPPYGYKRGEDGITLAFDGDAADIVRMVFNMRCQGESANKIAKHLNREGIPSPQSRRYQLGQITHEKYSGRIMWNIGMVSRMLQNETYTGSLVQGKYNCEGKRHILLPKEQWIVHENKHPAIISKEQFDMVSQLMGESAEKYKHTHEYPTFENHYIGKMFCSRCGKAAIRCDGGRRDRLVYYYCCRHCTDELKHEQGLAEAPKLPLIKLDAAVMKLLRMYMDTLVQFDGLAEMLAKSDPLLKKRAEVASDIAKMEKTVNNYEGTLSKAYIHHLDGLLDLREYELVRTKIENDKKEAEAWLKKISIEQKRYSVDNALENKWLVKYNAFRNCETPTKELIQTLVGRITIEPLTNELNIKLNFIDSFEDLRQLMQEGGVTINVQPNEAKHA